MHHSDAGYMECRTKESSYPQVISRRSERFKHPFNHVICLLATTKNPCSFGKQSGRRVVVPSKIGLRFLAASFAAFNPTIARNLINIRQRKLAVVTMPAANRPAESFRGARGKKKNVAGLGNHAKAFSSGL